MFRTRDFILVFTSVTFLLMAIGVTLFDNRLEANTQTQILLAQPLDATEPAQVLANSTLSRSDKLQSMREKIAASSELSISNQMPEMLSDEATSTVEISVTEADKTLALCANYRASSVPWDATKIFIEEVEGARIVFTESLREVPAQVQTSTSTVLVVIEPYKEMLLELPIRSFPSTNTSCIASDVIGIANDGSLIRNSEAGLYGIFSSGTVVGYALDGFPIHGAGTGTSDACGGKMGVAGYYYQISEDRPTIINCFAAAPIIF